MSALRSSSSSAAVGAEFVEELASRRACASQPRLGAEVAEVIRRTACRWRRGASGRRRRSTDARRARSAHQRPRVFISTPRLDQVVQLDEQSLLVHAQAGLTGLELERILAPRGLSIGDYPPVVLTSSLGGIIAVRTPGKSSARHGFFEDAVVGVSAVLADGRTVHTRVAPRRSTGPDLARALCGSEGTIGFITSAVLRIHAQARGAARRGVSVAVGRRRDRRGLPRAARRSRAVGPAHLRRRRSRARTSAVCPHAAPTATRCLCAATAGPTDLAACDRDLITSAVIAEGGRSHEHALAELWWEAHARRRADARSAAVAADHGDARASCARSITP